jgi:hypothetical protein
MNRTKRDKSKRNLIIISLWCLAIEFVYFVMLLGRLELLLSITCWIPLIMMFGMGILMSISLMRQHSDWPVRYIAIVLLMIHVFVIFTIFRVSVSITEIKYTRSASIPSGRTEFKCGSSAVLAF